VNTGVEFFILLLYAWVYKFKQVTFLYEKSVGTMMSAWLQSNHGDKSVLTLSDMNILTYNVLLPVERKKGFVFLTESVSMGNLCCILYL
jgi:hypothetical protein